MNLLIVDDERYIVKLSVCSDRRTYRNRFEYSESLFWIRSAGNPFDF